MPAFSAKDCSELKSSTVNWIVLGVARSAVVALRTIEPIAWFTLARSGASTSRKLSSVASAGIETLIGVRSRMGRPTRDPRPSRWLRPCRSAPGHRSSTSGLNMAILSGVSRIE